MKYTLIIVTLLAATTVFLVGCQPAVTNSNSGANGVNSANANQPSNTNTTTVNAAPANTATSTSVGSLATPTDAYKTAYALRAKKDVAGLKKIMSPDIKEFLTMMGDEKKTLDDMIMEMCEKPQADRAETRNEKINGDMATVEYLTETGGWKTMDFEKIDGQWMLGFPKADKAGEGGPKKKQ